MISSDTVTFISRNNTVAQDQTLKTNLPSFVEAQDLKAAVNLSSERHVMSACLPITHLECHFSTTARGGLEPP